MEWNHIKMKKFKFYQLLIVAVLFENLMFSVQSIITLSYISIYKVDKPIFIKISRGKLYFSVFKLLSYTVLILLIGSVFQSVKNILLNSNLHILYDILISLFLLNLRKIFHILQFKFAGTIETNF